MWVYILSEKGYCEDVGDWYLYTEGLEATGVKV